MNSYDVIITGAGIIGLSLALELRRRGATVLVLERGKPGQEASSAAAGMLSPHDPATPLLLRPMAIESARIFPEYVERLEELSGVCTDFRRHGTLVFSRSEDVPMAYRKLAPDDLRRLEPRLKARRCSTYFVQENSVDPRLLLQAAVLAARRQAVTIRSHVEVKELRARGKSIEVITSRGKLEAAAAVNCRGAWSGAPVRPRKGQMLYLQPDQPNLLRHVVHAPEVYIVPRSSGKILVGATLEDVGFDTSVSQEVIRELRTAATKYLRELGTALIVESWAGLRPGTPDDLPILGPTATPGIFVATGHFRNGILLAPITAKIVADLVTGTGTPRDNSAFAAARFEPKRNVRKEHAEATL